jgi:hypothetical protein
MRRADLISKIDADTLPGKYFVGFAFDKATERQVTALRKQIMKKFALASNDWVHFELDESSTSFVQKSDYVVAQFVEAGWMSEHPLQSRSKIEAYKEALSYKGQTITIRVTAKAACHAEVIDTLIFKSKLCTPELNAVNNGEIYEIRAKIAEVKDVQFKVDNSWVKDQMRNAAPTDPEYIYRERADQYICLNSIEDRDRHCNEKNLKKLSP